MAFVLIGFMGAGKSTVAAKLAIARGLVALDSDALLEQRSGRPIAREFELSGETSFRAGEETLVCELLRDADPHDVIALGGGSVLSERVREALSAHLVVLLDVDLAAAWERVGAAHNGAERPLARDPETFAALYAERRSLYEELADAVLLWASPPSGQYPVLVGRGLLRHADEDKLAALWPLRRSWSRRFLVSDETVSALYADRLGEVSGTIAIPPGEPHKTLACAERVWRELAACGMTRSDHVVALGGGVVGDLAGFCAATYQRGVPVIHVPTTLVAQVDSAYGGKTGVDLPDAKNYVGAYHQPAGVLVDPDLLATLPAPELAAGWVEVLKTALIAGAGLWERVCAAAGCEVDERTILDCARAKLAIINADERDSGRRQALNLGHTVGHAIETVTGYARYRHGEAVGLGLLAALRLSGADALREQVRELLRRRDLPVVLDGVDADVEQILAATARDKKRLGTGAVPFVLVHAPGEVEIGCKVAESDLRAAVRELISP
ncbi:MAG TPA: bifunctional shikimate kinase/3-dehydroquinate synthase [Solirubrobacteraceae bacterium]|nr:bifunctional shikimate kinase/3-dehydroquinate synthase [Solirubrobacteraceae bacterium]